MVRRKPLSIRAHTRALAIGYKRLTFSFGERYLVVLKTLHTFNTNIYFLVSKSLFSALRVHIILYMNIHFNFFFSFLNVRVCIIHVYKM